MKPHVCKLPGFGKIWYAFHSREHRDRALAAHQQLYFTARPLRAQDDAMAWGNTFCHTLSRYFSAIPGSPP